MTHCPPTDLSKTAIRHNSFYIYIYIYIYIQYWMFDLQKTKRCLVKILIPGCIWHSSCYNREVSVNTSYEELEVGDLVCGDACHHIGVRSGIRWLDDVFDSGSNTSLHCTNDRRRISDYRASCVTLEPRLCNASHLLACHWNDLFVRSSIHRLVKAVGDMHETGCRINLRKIDERDMWWLHRTKAHAQ